LTVESKNVKSGRAARFSELKGCGGKKKGGKTQALDDPNSSASAAEGGTPNLPLIWMVRGPEGKRREGCPIVEAQRSNV